MHARHVALPVRLQAVEQQRIACSHRVLVPGPYQLPAPPTSKAACCLGKPFLGLAATWPSAQAEKLPCIGGPPSSHSDCCTKHAEIPLVGPCQPRRNPAAQARPLTLGNAVSPPSRSLARRYSSTVAILGLSLSRLSSAGAQSLGLEERQTTGMHKLYQFACCAPGR